MGRVKIPIPRTQLACLYLKEGKPLAAIARIFNCDRVTISNRLKEFGFPQRAKSEALMRYKKFDFRGDNVEKAYLIGFRLGDLNVYKTVPTAKTIVVRCHTTSKDQVNLINKLFSNYGQVTISKTRENKYQVNCFLNDSFDFLLPKGDFVTSWIKTSDKYSGAFIGGYIDAEGCFMINQGRARLQIDSYDREILRFIHRWFSKNRIISKYKLLYRKGSSRGGGLTWRGSLYRVNVNDAASLLRALSLLGPWIKHKKRLADIKIVKNNILERIRQGHVE